jgi:hypothetical protein
LSKKERKDPRRDHSMKEILVIYKPMGAERMRMRVVQALSRTSGRNG